MCHEGVAVTECEVPDCVCNLVGECKEIARESLYNTFMRFGLSGERETHITEHHRDTPVNRQPLYIVAVCLPCAFCCLDLGRAPGTKNVH
jgi:hypothetical protein